MLFMKRFALILTLLFNFIFCLVGYAQIPQGINYQAIVRDAGGKPVTAGPIPVVITITNGSGNFSETHNLTPNQFGLVNLVVGSVKTAEFQAFDFLDSPTTITVMANSVNLGSQPLQSVPYSLSAQNALQLNGVEVDFSGIQNGQVLVYNQAGTKMVAGNIKVNAVVDADSDTYVHVEKSADSDEILFQTAGTQRMKITSGGQIGVGVATPDTKTDVHTANLIRAAGGYFGNIKPSTVTFGIQHTSLLLDAMQYALLQDKFGGTTINSYDEYASSILHLQNNGVDQAIITNQGVLNTNFNSVFRLKGLVQNVYQAAGKMQFEHTISGTSFVSSEMMGAMGSAQDMGELRLSTMFKGTLNEAVVINEKTEVTIKSLSGGGFVVADATGKLGIGSVSAEIDPQVGANVLNYVPKWNGTSLNQGLIYDNGTNVSIGTSTPSNLFQIQQTVTGATPMMRISNGHATGDASMLFMGGTTYYSIGSDASANSFKISSGTSGLGVNDRFVITSAGSVGIGTETPSEKLEIGNGISGGVNLSINNSNALSPFGLSFKNAGVYRAGIGYSNTATQDWFFMYGAGGGNFLRSKNNSVVVGEANPATFATTFENTGSMSVRVRNITASTSLNATDYIITNTGSGVTLTIPTSEATQGRIIFVRNLSTTNMNLVSTQLIISHSSATPFNTITLLALNSTDTRDDCWLVFNGVNWVVLD